MACGLRRLIHEVDCPGGDLLVHRLHALVRQRAGVFALLLADFAEARIVSRIVLVRRETVQHAARAELRLESRVFRIVDVLRLFFGVEVVEIAEPLIEAVDRGQHLVAVAKMVLAELARRIAQRLEQFGEGRVFLLQALGRARQADFGEAGADRRLPGDERRATGGAALLAVPVREERAFLGDAVYVRRL